MNRFQILIGATKKKNAINHQTTMIMRQRTVIIEIQSGNIF